MMRHDHAILSRFPKRRPELPQAYRAIYAAHYQQNRAGGSPASFLSKLTESWMHRKVAEDVAKDARNLSTLEIGAGNLNHLRYEPLSGCYAVVEPLTDLFADSPYRPRVSNIYRNLAEVPDRTFDRIISIAAFEHYCDLPDVVARCGLLLAPKGQLRVAIPSEGTLLWNFAFSLTTGLEFRLKHGLDYGVLMRHEHVNTAEEIAWVLQFLFVNVKRWLFGLTPALSIYQFFRCSDPFLERCRFLLNRRDAASLL